MEGIVGLLEKAKGYPIERILFPVGNDFFDSDYDYSCNYKRNTKTNRSKMATKFQDRSQINNDGY